MTLAEQYRNLAAGLRAKIRSENNEKLKTEWENLAQSYLRLPKRRNCTTELIWSPSQVFVVSQRNSTVWNCNTVSGY